MNKEISDSLHFLLHCSLKAAGYETLREQFEFIYKYIENLEKENQKLKKQLEKKYSKIGTLTNEVLYEENTKLINQQKEFIEYLEDFIKQNETVVEVSKYGLPKNCSKLLIDFYKEILSKYNEIIGDKE